MSETSQHISVLLDEVIHYLDIKPSDIVVDGTINGGGHAVRIAEQLGTDGILVGIDQDSAGLALSHERLKKVLPTVHLVHRNTRYLDEILDELGIEEIDGLLLDLGWSTNQFENPERGFSFLHDGPLHMVLSDNPHDVSFTAFDIVNEWEESSLIDIFKGYGEEPFARRIAQNIIQARSIRPISTTGELADIISHSIPRRFHKKGFHPATQVFQALRIAVNDEMEVLKEILAKAFERLAPGGRMVIISFHSIEDRIVKNFFKYQSQEGQATLITKKPITPREEELFVNKRSRSAKLRVLQKR